VGKDVLIAVVEDVLANMQRNIPTGTEDSELDAMASQRILFLNWLRRQPGPNVAVALYPLHDAAWTLIGQMPQLHS
jgi:hypothetical protein